MSLTLEQKGGHVANLFSAYAPTLPTPDDAKDEFYNQLDQIISLTPCKHKLIMMGDFSAPVGCDHQAWEKVLGRHGIGKENSNGNWLLSLCTVHKLMITNMMFQQRDSHKISWMHPCSRHWHLLDYVIVRQRGTADLNLTQSLCGSTCWSDHCMICSKLALQLAPKRCYKFRPAKKLCVQWLQDLDMLHNFQLKLDKELQNIPAADTAEGEWSQLKEATYKAETAGFRRCVHHDWFNDNDNEATAVNMVLHCSPTGLIYCSIGLSTSSPC